MMILDQNDRKGAVRYAVQKPLASVPSVVMSSTVKKHFAVAQLLDAPGFNLTLEIHIDQWHGLCYYFVFWLFYKMSHKMK